MIITEKYKETSPKTKNIYSNEFYKYYSEYTPYNQKKQNLSEKEYYSNQNYFVNNKKLNSTLNYDELFSSYKKKMLFGNTDLRNEYSPIADTRVNIRKKLLEERSIPQLYKNNSYEDLLENFQYHESRNIRNNSEKKYDSITRIVEYSNLIQNILK